jgi:hypothetical protein
MNLFVQFRNWSLGKVVRTWDPELPTDSYATGAAMDPNGNLWVGALDILPSARVQGTSAAQPASQELVTLLNSEGRIQKQWRFPSTRDAQGQVPPAGGLALGRPGEVYLTYGSQVLVMNETP